MSKPRVGFIGLGIMGTSMAKNLLKAGFSVSVFNRTPAKTAPLKELGAGVYDSPRKLATDVEVLCLSLTRGDAVQDVLFGDEGAAHTAKRGTLVIDLSTVAPREATSFSKQLLQRDVHFVDAPVTGGDVGAREGTLTIMVGGTVEDFLRAKQVLEVLGKRVVYVGGVGAGQLTKAVNQILVAGSVAAMTEGIAFARAAGLDLEKTLEVVASGAAGSWSLQNYAPRLLRGEYGPGFYAKDMLKDLRIALSEADALNLSLPVSQIIKELYVAFCNGEGKSLGNHALLRLYDTLSPSNGCE